MFCVSFFLVCVNNMSIYNNFRKPYLLAHIFFISFLANGKLYIFFEYFFHIFFIPNTQILSYCPFKSILRGFYFKVDNYTTRGVSLKFGQNKRQILICFFFSYFDTLSLVLFSFFYTLDVLYNILSMLSLPFARELGRTSFYTLSFSL